MKSENIWTSRYASGGNSGLGSQNELLKFKIDWINDRVKKYDIRSVLDFGHGDLNVARGLEVESYVGLDIFTPDDSHDMTIIKSRFDSFDGPNADMVICLDVLYHILEDEPIDLVGDGLEADAEAAAVTAPPAEDMPRWASLALTLSLLLFFFRKQILERLGGAAPTTSGADPASAHSAPAPAATRLLFA